MNHATSRSTLMAVAIATCCQWVLSMPRDRVRRRPRRTPLRAGAFKPRPAFVEIALGVGTEPRGPPLTPRLLRGDGTASSAPAWPGYRAPAPHRPDNPPDATARRWRPAGRGVPFTPRRRPFSLRTPRTCWWSQSISHWSMSQARPLSAANSHCHRWNQASRCPAAIPGPRGRVAIGGSDPVCLQGEVCCGQCLIEIVRAHRPVDRCRGRLDIGSSGVRRARPRRLHSHGPWSLSTGCCLWCSSRRQHQRGMRVRRRPWSFQL